jgi:hypothetical protein
MSTVQLANLFFESTGNNRIHAVTSTVGSNLNIVVANNINYTGIANGGFYANAAVSSLLLVVPKTDNYTLTAADHNALITVSNTASKTITVSSLPVGFKCLVYMINTGNVVIGNTTGVTLTTRNDGYTISTQYGGVSVFVSSSNTAVIDGINDA